MKPLIVMALESEGQGRLESLGYEVLYCGVGKVNATYHLTKRLMAAKHENISISMVLNLGSAGSNVFAKGTLVEANSYVQHDMDATGLGFDHGTTPFDLYPPIITLPRVFPSLPHGVCGSGDCFLQRDAPILCEVIDMEAYGLAKVCLMEAISFSAIKYITDGGDDAASGDWKSNVVLAADAFYGLLSKKNDWDPIL